MPRLARREVVAGHRLFHVVARGVERRPIVADDHDRRAFLALLLLTTLRHRWDVHAFCLMDNHLHLVVEADPEDLSRGMHCLLFRHAQRFNQRHGRWGHLFGDR